MAVTPTPWMEDDEQRAVGMLCSKAAGGLLCLVVGGWIEEIFCENFCHGDSVDWICGMILKKIYKNKV
jgi:hypothetical protein